jgi:hypothetical protein
MTSDEERVPDPTDLPDGSAADHPKRERTSMDYDLEPSEDPLEAREEEAAVAEVRAIGGRPPEYVSDDDDAPVDPEERPLAEAGEGVSEGFEQAEADLREEATHGDERRSPEADEFSPEEESDRATSVYAEPDELDPTEVLRDPREGEDDPGAGTPLAPDR